MTTIWRNAALATMADEAPAELLVHGALVADGATLVWAGPAGSVPRELRAAATQEHDLGGALLTPGLIDCHTHLVYGADRAGEFELRLQGASYEDLARAGGGIRATVDATRQASEDELHALAGRRLEAMLAQGITTVEIKSGYGLSLEHEERMLRVARRLGHSHAVGVRTSYLGAHALAPEFEARPDAYIDECCRWLGRLHALGLVDAVDAYCDRTGFTREQTRRVFEAAQALRLPVKLHAEQCSNRHGAALAARFAALSCDHLEYLDEAGVGALAASGTVAVLLPAAFYYLRQTQPPPVRALRAAGVPIAIASDHNPGTAPVLAPLLILNMACVLFGLSAWEALRGATVHAARALGLGASHGVLAPGRRADFVVWDAAHPRDLVYGIGPVRCRRVYGGTEQRT